jgi:hypothetical protein
MSTDRLSRRIAIAAGGAALVVMGSLTACSPTKEKEAPSTTSTPAPSSSSAAPSPTEKAILPGGPSFSPTVNPAPPGAVCKQVVNGVCMR